jgi:hypothetical protein
MQWLHEKLECALEGPARTILLHDYLSPVNVWHQSVGEYPVVRFRGCRPVEGRAASCSAIWWLGVMTEARRTRQSRWGGALWVLLPSLLGVRGMYEND